MTVPSHTPSPHDPLTDPPATPAHHLQLIPPRPDQTGKAARLGVHAKVALIWTATQLGTFLRWVVVHARAILAHRAAVGAIAVGATLILTLVAVALLRQGSTTGFVPSLLVLFAIQAVLVVAAAAHGAATHPLGQRFDDAFSRLAENASELGGHLDQLVAGRSEYSGLMVALTQVRHEAAHHVTLIPHHVDSTNAGYRRGVRLGMDEPDDTPLWTDGSHGTDQGDGATFVDTFWAQRGETLPSRLDCDDLLQQVGELDTEEPR